MLKWLSPLMVAFVAMVSLKCGTGTTEPVEEFPEIFGFIFDGGYQDCETNSEIYSGTIYLANYFDSAPMIKINDNPVFVDVSSLDAYFHTVNKSRNTFWYEIHYKGDVLVDTIKLPERVDSIYCNGVLLPDTDVVWIDSADSYVFSWPKRDDHLNYSAGCGGSFLKVAAITDTSFTVVDTGHSLPIEGEPLDSMSFGSFSVESQLRGAPDSTGVLWLHNNHRKRSGRLYSYYGILSGRCRGFLFGIRRP